ncbi:hypothetical protein TRFO_06815 [Tritrichomonas foetus]|uniref:Cytoplasmic dynein 2 light intermediate chain 1 n=1 Tax=Tritrichomonas foetus TaxID=1144522 RepID=A0A1J4K081_9EUKA|nr:hypothetical protein TRFO_06815 [Tritrichomonas foetus]|eukprot:OHT03150.1 hypothetical protein TRFO_06815 [Tritrichomonas foetus]
MSDIWGTQINESPYKKQEFGAGDPNMLFVGSEKSGKTSLLNIFFKRQEEPHPTLALTYQSCGVKVAGRPITLHAWELGGGLQLESILDTIVTENTQNGFLIFICLDLSSASSIIDAVDWAERVDSRFAEKRRAVFFIGTHYDVFEGKDPHEKEIIVKGLRAVAAQHNAGICFTSTKHENLKARFKNIIKYVGIANAKIKEKEDDNSKPIIFGPGEDSDSKNDNDSVAAMMNQMAQEAANEREKSPKDHTNPAQNPQFAEEDIDQLCAARKSELVEQTKRSEKKSK